MKPKNNCYIDMSMVCELAHELTIAECKERKIRVDDPKNDGTLYTTKAQAVFDRNYDLITRILNV